MVQDTCTSGGIDFLVIRTISNGALDTSFGDLNALDGTRTGSAHINFYGSDDLTRGMTLDGADRPLVLGVVKDPSTGTTYDGLARLTTSGDIDLSFGSGGAVAFDFLEPQAGSADRALALQSDGKIVFGGGFYANNTSYRVLGRLTP